ncbi:MAG TPA: sugar transferase [Solirubrobacterales bacterium]|nr:sugar transferase [Solirubrobacterales bacterium]
MSSRYSRQPGTAKVGVFTRTVDCFVLLLLLPVLLPAGLLIAAVVFADSPGSVFYRATRIGLNGHPFQMLKFRTMKTGAKGPGLSTSFDPRFTPVGRFLARYRLDELPQFWNVVKGDMRVVGPRPEDPDFVRRHKKEYDEILKVAPGITGLTQLVHFLDDLDTNNPLAHYETILPGKILLDVRYVQTQSFLGDVAILLRTMLIPFRLIADEIKVLIDAQRSHPEAATRFAVGGTSFVLSIVLVIAFLAGGGPTG